MSDNQNLQSLLDTQTGQLNLVFGDSNSIDAKALAILGANIAVVLFIDAATLHLALWQFIVLYAPFVASLALDILAIWPRAYSAVIPNQERITHYLDLSHHDLLLQLLANTQSALENNEKLNRKRLRICSLSIALTGLGFLALLLIL